MQRGISPETRSRWYGATNEIRNYEFKEHKTTMHILSLNTKTVEINIAYVVVQFYPWFKFYFPLFLGMVMYDNEFETKENKI